MSLHIIKKHAAITDMEPKPLMITGVLIVAALDFGSLLMPNDLKKLTDNPAKEQQVKLRVTFAATNIDCGYSDVGYTYFTPT